MDELLTVRTLTKKYGNTEALKSISMAARRGEITGLIGPDGAGKSSLMRIVLGLLRRDSGTVSLMGADPGTDRTLVRNRVGYMPEVFSLYTDLSVEENLEFSFRIHRGNPKEFAPKRDRLYRFNRLQNFSGTLAGNLSGGMKQKLALSCALMHDPSLLILDEPTTGVDPLSRREFWQMLKELRERGISILISTPYMEEALRCDRIYLMHKGTILLRGAPRKLLENFPGTILEIRSSTLASQDLRRRLSERFPEYPVYLSGKNVHISLPPGISDSLESRVRNLATDSIAPVLPDLEDLFLSEVLKREIP